MKIRLIAAAVMAVLAAVGILLVVNYVNTAEARALDGQEPREVYLVTQQIPEGTPVEDLDEFLHLQTVPAAIVPEDAVTDLGEHEGKVAAVTLQSGEQLLGSRLVDPTALEEPGSVPVPEGMQEVSVQLGPDRVVGGQLKAGDTVGVFISFSEAENGKPRTTLELHKVLITSVQGAPSAEAPTEEGAEAPADQAPPAPEGSTIVTLALKAADAEKVVFASEFGTLWLSHEPEDAEENDDGARMEDFG